MGTVKVSVVGDEIVIAFGNGAIFDLAAITTEGLRGIDREFDEAMKSGDYKLAQVRREQVMIGVDMLRKIEEIYGEEAKETLVKIS